MRIRYPFAGGFLALCLVAAYLGLGKPQLAINDKLQHFLMFFLLTVEAPISTAFSISL
jgi:hypothetical protein